VAILNEIRGVTYHIPIIAGGPHATFDPESLLIKGFDVCVRGEGDYTVVDVVEALERRRDGEKSLENIAGISYRIENGNIYHNKGREIIEELDQLPYPDWYQDDYERVLREHYIPAWNPINISPETILFTLMIESSRGCPYRCIFCTTSKIKGKKWRCKTTNRIIGEYQHFLDFYDRVIGHSFSRKKILIQFPDDNFCFNKNRVTTFCKLLMKYPSEDRPLWSCMARADSINNAQYLRLMKRAGCIRIFMGAECGYSEGLKKIRKGINIRTLNDAIDKVLCAKFPLIIVSWIIGFPWEKRKEALKTIAAALRTAIKDPDIIRTSIYTFTPIVGAEISESLGLYIEGKISDHGRSRSWGFRHPNMTDEDLIELRLAADYFIYLMNSFRNRWLRKVGHKKYIQSLIRRSLENMNIVRTEELKGLFGRMGLFISTHRKSKGTITKLKKNIYRWIDLLCQLP